MLMEFLQIFMVAWFFVLLVWPTIIKSIIMVYVWKHSDQIVYKKETSGDILAMGTVWHLGGGYDIPEVSYVEATLNLDFGYYMTWKIWDDGTYVDWLTSRQESRNWWNRETIDVRKRLELKSTSLSGFTTFQRTSKAVMMISTRFFFGRMLRRFTDEPFVMAKMAGFKTS